MGSKTYFMTSTSEWERPVDLKDTQLPSFRYNEYGDIIEQDDK